MILSRLYYDTGDGLQEEIDRVKQQLWTLDDQITQLQEQRDSLRKEVDLLQIKQRTNCSQANEKWWVILDKNGRDGVIVLCKLKPRTDIDIALETDDPEEEFIFEAGTFTVGRSFEDEAEAHAELMVRCNAHQTPPSQYALDNLSSNVNV